MKRSEILKIIQQAIVDHNKSIGDFEGYGAYSHELILERILEAGMHPPETYMKNMPKVDGNKVVLAWEEENEEE